MSAGPTVSVVGLGGNNFGSRLDQDGTRAVVDAALDAGITLFDTADTYGGYGERRRRRATANGCSAPPSRAAGTRSCWPPSSAWRWGRSPTASARGEPGPTSGTP